MRRVKTSCVKTSCVKTSGVQTISVFTLTRGNTQEFQWTCFNLFLTWHKWREISNPIWLFGDQDFFLTSVMWPHHQMQPIKRSWRNDQLGSTLTSDIFYSAHLFVNLCVYLCEGAFLLVNECGLTERFAEMIETNKQFVLSVAPPRPPPPRITSTNLWNF